MPPEGDFQEDDLPVLGQDDDDLGMSDEEETSGVSDGKIKAAFVKLRQERKALREELETTRSKLNELSGQVTQVQRERREHPDDQIGLRRRYRDSVRQRAVQNLTGEVFATEDERNMAVWQEMQAIAANDAAELAMQRVISIQAPQVVDNVFSGFSQLDEGDKAEIRKVVEALPPNLRVDPQAIRKEVHSYIGQNFEKFTRPPEEQQNDKGKKRTGTPATGQQTSDGRVRLSESAAAAAASGLKGGSLGVRLTETPQGASRKRAEALTEEDIATMRSQGADPNDPEEVKLFHEAKEKAKRASMGLA